MLKWIKKNKENVECFFSAFGLILIIYVFAYFNGSFKEAYKQVLESNDVGFKVGFWGAIVIIPFFTGFCVVFFNWITDKIILFIKMIIGKIKEKTHSAK